MLYLDQLSGNVRRAGFGRSDPLKEAQPQVIYLRLESGSFFEFSQPHKINYVQKLAMRICILPQEISSAHGWATLPTFCSVFLCINILDTLLLLPLYGM